MHLSIGRYMGVDMPWLPTAHTYLSSLTQVYAHSDYFAGRSMWDSSQFTEIPNAKLDQTCTVLGGLNVYRVVQTQIDWKNVIRLPPEPPNSSHFLFCFAMK